MESRPHDECRAVICSYALLHSSTFSFMHAHGQLAKLLIVVAELKHVIALTKPIRGPVSCVLLIANGLFDLALLCQIKSLLTQERFV
jgi:hypothetical protein